jgi:hypothetical protein
VPPHQNPSQAASLHAASPKDSLSNNGSCQKRKSRSLSWSAPWEIKCQSTPCRNRLAALSKNKKPTRPRIGFPFYILHSAFRLYPQRDSRRSAALLAENSCYRLPTLDTLRYFSVGMGHSCEKSVSRSVSRWDSAAVSLVPPMGFGNYCIRSAIHSQSFVNIV